MAGMKSLQPRFEQRAILGRLEPVGSQDRELVTAMLLAQAPNEVLTLVVLRQSRRGRQGEGKSDEGAGHVSSRLAERWWAERQSRQEQGEHGKIATSRDCLK